MNHFSLPNASRFVYAFTFLVSANLTTAWAQKTSKTIEPALTTQADFIARSPKFTRPQSAASDVIASRTTSDCNLIPNPSFEDQLGGAPSGSIANILTASSSRDELAVWRSTNGSTPDYYATNAPTFSMTNPLSSSASFGPFTPFGYNPTLRNGTVGLWISVPFNDQEYITPRTPIYVPDAGNYYAAFRAYRSERSADATKLGMNVTAYTGTPISTSSVSTVFTRASTSIESAAILQSSSWQLVSGRITLSSAGQYDVNIGNLSPTLHNANGVAYYFIDEVQLYKIPTAGPNVNCLLGSVTLGEGCPIPGATYEWYNETSDLPVATTLNYTVSTSGQYILVVTLPDGSTDQTTANVGVCPCSQPSITAKDYQSSGQPVYNDWDSVPLDTPLELTAGVLIPGATYTWSVVAPSQQTPGYLAPYNYWIDSHLGQQPNVFYIRPTAPRQPYSFLDFTIQCVVSGACEPLYFNFRSVAGVTTDPPRGTNQPKQSAYPNPANDWLTISSDVQDAALLDGHGKPVLRIPASGRINVQDLPSGLYNLQMKQDGKVVNQRIQIAH